MEPGAAELAWACFAGLCGGVVWLVLQRQVSGRLAVTVCVISSTFGMFCGDLIGSYFHISRAGAGFLCGISSMWFSVKLADGTFLEIGRSWLVHRLKIDEERHKLKHERKE